jgi:polyribonucleotide nucleotidyltransferase
VQVICLVISGDQENDPDILAVNGASAALCLSGIPFDGPIGAVRVGLVEGKLIANPTTTQQKVSSLELVIAATADAVLMVESGANEIPEESMLEAIAWPRRVQAIGAGAARSGAARRQAPLGLRRVRRP